MSEGRISVEGREVYIASVFISRFTFLLSHFCFNARQRTREEAAERRVLM